MFCEELSSFLVIRRRLFDSDIYELTSGVEKLRVSDSAFIDTIKPVIAYIFVSSLHSQIQYLSSNVYCLVLHLCHGIIDIGWI